MEESIKTISYTRGADIGSILRSGSRRQEENAERSSMEIVEQIREGGDEMVLSCLRKFDNFECTADRLLVNEQEYAQAEKQISPELAEAIEIAISNVRKFHQAQQVPDIEVETMPGVICKQKSVPIEKVGLYIPGGTAPLFSTVIMLAVPAKIAGCRKIIMCSPVNKNGVIAPEVLYCAKRCGVDKVYKIGGAAAIGAMAFGTEHVEKVYKIFGPGNSYVTAAKQYVSKAVCAIDMPAGPSEVMVIADGQADATFVASDFLSQAEHGADSQSILLTTDEGLAHAVVQSVAGLLELLPRQQLAMQSLAGSRVILLHDDDEMMQFANMYAPEHLIINHADAERLALKVENAGSVFLGAFSPESAGDYASGTNHTLPTGGWARSYSGVNIDSFMKKITFQRLSRSGLASIAPAITTMARGEGLYAHSLAVEVRLNNDKNS